MRPARRWPLAAPGTPRRSAGSRRAGSGVTADGPLTAAQAGEWDRMVGVGRRDRARRVPLVRAPAYGTRRRSAGRRAADPRAGGVPTDCARSTRSSAGRRPRDGGPARHRRPTPGWAARRPGDLAAPPARPGAAQAFAAALVARYGPRGTFWAEHPDLPRLPIRAWQVFNEPNHTGFWSEPPYAPTYVAALRAADRHPRRRPGRDDRARRAHQPQLARAAPALQRRRARACSTSSPCTRTRAGRGRAEARAARPPRDGEARRRRAADLDHRAELAGGEGRKRAGRGIGIEDGARPGGAARAGAAAARPRPPRERIGGSSGTRGSRAARARARSTGRACGCGARAPSCPTPALRVFRIAARRLEGCRKAPGDARRCA